MIAGDWGSDLVDFLLPTGCVSCRSWIPRAEGTALICGVCRSRLRAPAWPRCPRCHHPLGTGRRRGAEPVDCVECREWPAALSRARFACPLSGPAADLVHALKYEGWAEVARDMCDLLETTVRRHVVPAGGWGRSTKALVVPMPTTPARERHRGYNQSMLLAEDLAARLGLPLRPILIRPSGTSSQTSLSPAQRRENVRGAFVVRGSVGGELRGADVVLVDDVLTTGATASEAASELARGGAKSVTLVAFARATAPRPGTRR